MPTLARTLKQQVSSNLPVSAGCDLDSATRLTTASDVTISPSCALGWRSATFSADPAPLRLQLRLRLARGARHERHMCAINGGSCSLSLPAVHSRPAGGTLPDHGTRPPPLPGTPRHATARYGAGLRWHGTRLLLLAVWRFQHPLSCQ